MSMNAPTVRRAGLGRGQSERRLRLQHDRDHRHGRSINYNKRLIAFFNGNGQKRIIAINPSVPGLNQIHVGDSVVLLVTRSVAVKVMPV